MFFYTLLIFCLLFKLPLTHFYFFSLLLFCLLFSCWNLRQRPTSRQDPDPIIPCQDNHHPYTHANNPHNQRTLTRDKVYHNPLYVTSLCFLIFPNK